MLFELPEDFFAVFDGFNQEPLLFSETPQKLSLGFFHLRQ